MAIPLVHILPNSITRVLAGSWNNNPGDNNMNKTTETMTGWGGNGTNVFLGGEGEGDDAKLGVKEGMSLKGRSYEPGFICVKKFQKLKEYTGRQFDKRRAFKAIHEVRNYCHGYVFVHVAFTVFAEVHATDIN
ncbi:hypothetical protein GOBAR_DD26865 [Gossypium barbadense]|nr:hypothetical protein GOBAR_DD26865 [Gossypium barbadense]